MLGHATGRPGGRQEAAMFELSERRWGTASPESFYLTRLRRFAGLVAAADAGDVPEWRQLARRATLCAYRDCVALGHADAARAALASAQTDGAGRAAELRPQPAPGPVRTPGRGRPARAV
jgi:hypothetical protein